MEEQNVQQSEQTTEYEQPPEQQAEGQPTDDGPRQEEFDDYDKYFEARTQWIVQRQVGNAVKEGHKEGLKPPSPVWDPRPDSNRIELEQEAKKWEASCLAKAKKAEDDGDLFTARDWKQRSGFKREEVEALPPDPRQQVQKHLEDDELLRSILPLGEARLDGNNEFWNHPRVQNDSLVQLVRFNRDHSGARLVLPKETSPHGSLEEVRPSTTVFFDLPREVVQNIRNGVFGNPSYKTPAQILEGLWDGIRASGYASAGRPTIGQPGEKPPEVDLSLVDQRTFDKIRNENDRKKRGKIY